MEFDKFEKIRITGSNGVVGSFIYGELKSLGLSVFPIKRQKEDNSYILDDGFDSKSELIIHCGVPSHPRTRKKRMMYLENTIRLFDWAAKNDFELIFVSSHSSRSSNYSLYSQDKGIFEELAISMGFRVLKLGVFIGPKVSRINVTLDFLREISVPFIQSSLRNIPTSQSKYLLTSLVNLTNSNYKMWGWVKGSTFGVALEDVEIQKVTNGVTRRTLGNYKEKKSWRIRLVNLSCFLTFGLADPFINLGYDVKYYAK